MDSISVWECVEIRISCEDEIVLRSLKVVPKSGFTDTYVKYIQFNVFMVLSLHVLQN